MRSFVFKIRLAALACGSLAAGAPSAGVQVQAKKLQLKKTVNSPPNTTQQGSPADSSQDEAMKGYLAEWKGISPSRAILKRLLRGGVEEQDFLHRGSDLLKEWCKLTEKNEKDRKLNGQWKNATDDVAFMTNLLKNNKPIEASCVLHIAGRGVTSDFSFMKKVLEKIDGDGEEKRAVSARREVLYLLVKNLDSKRWTKEHDGASIRELATELQSRATCFSDFLSASQFTRVDDRKAFDEEHEFYAMVEWDLKCEKDNRKIERWFPLQMQEYRKIFENKLNNNQQ